MKLTFLGTGTSMGVPVAGGFMREELFHDPRNERMRCSIWVQTNECSFLIDVGPEYRMQSIRSGIKSVDFVLVTHEHMDHIGGLDELRMYNYKKKGPIEVYTTQSACDSIKNRFDYMFGEKKYPGSTSLDLKVITAPMNIGDVEITPLPISHGSLEILGYRLNNTAYLTDVKHIPESTIELLNGCETIILSALRWEPEHPTHLTIPEAVEIIEQTQIYEAYLIHMNSYVDHESTNKKLPPHIKLAFDMQTIPLR
ncbi:MAG: MBL fold metallo-hydrolase [Balneolaceae bacterium]|nr:MBL fold metallo-hydrolase [Balneolaceae bacterium]